MTDINWNSGWKKPVRIRWGLRANTLALTSPLTGQVQTVGMPGARWFVTLEWPPLTEAQSRQIESLRAQLRGRANRLLLWHLARPALRGAGGGTPVVNGASQTGSSLNVSGLPNSLTNWALAGDMVGIGGELKMLTANASSNGSGQATLTFEPPLRASPGNGSAIVVSQPTARFMLGGDDAEWLHEPGRFISGHALDLVEAFT